MIKNYFSFNFNCQRKNILYENGFGFADKNKTILTTPHTVYRVGSISKIFTAIAAMQLSENGILNIDAPIQTQLPNFHPKILSARQSLFGK